MHPLWQVLNFTSSFKYLGDIWDVIEDDGMGDQVVARNERTGQEDPINIYCLVEPIGGKPT